MIFVNESLDERRAYLSKELASGVSEVTFTKVDGSQRIMPCTLRESVLPARSGEQASKSVEKREKAMNVLSVWCLDQMAWRSFRVDNVTEIKIL